MPAHAPQSEELVTELCRHPYVPFRDEAPPGYEDRERRVKRSSMLVRNVVGRPAAMSTSRATFRRRLARRMGALRASGTVQEY